MKRFAIILLILITAFYMMGCKKNAKNDESVKGSEDNITQTVQQNEEPSENDQTVTITPTPDNTNHEGEMRSYLTGLWVPVEIGTKRPIAFQFNNFKTVSNQWGIGQADIVYECLVEGGITRLLGIGENYTGDRIGSTRSARHYFVSIADEYDAIYVHYGKTKYATSKMKTLGIDHMDGSEGIGTTVFYRDKTIKQPHNAFASLDGILKGIEKKGFETQYEAGYVSHYTFYDTDTDLSSTNDANKITLKFSGYTSPYFEYNADDKLYYRFQYGAPHKDSLTGEQLAFKNIIIQFVKEWNIDKNGYQTMDLEDAAGRGYYFTNGKVVLITWKKKEADGWMRYYNEAGEELTINPGKTFIALFPQDRTEDVTIK
ncbi:MAG TPA: DUF3048 domain-containing protein [Mobilitalea sp.]|nr:DUF3048 domain-containing protein [Mobilitalea sp.]